MKVATEKHPAEIALRKIEEFLQRNKMIITIDPYSGLCVSYKNMDFSIRENGNDERTGSNQLPRELEEERLFLMNEEELKPNISGWLKV